MMFASNRLIFACLVTQISIWVIDVPVYATRINLNPAEEPTSFEVNSNYRMLMRNQRLFYLRSANVSIDDIILHPKQIEDRYGGYQQGTFEFNASEIFRKTSTILWFVPIEEIAALQVYDNPRDQEMASGPQVNQELCGLHLDYMHHMVKKHLTNLSNSTELSIFRIMNFFDSPRVGIATGNKLFLGDYMSCKDAELNVIKEELLKVNRTSGESYFRMVKENLVNQPGDSQAKSVLKLLLHLLGPFVGFARDRDVGIPIERHIDKTILLPSRYCLASIRYPDWPNTTFYKRNLSWRTATCLPETCDSFSIEYHAEKIKRLIDFQLSKHHEGYYVDHLYCLPDESSPLRDPMNFTSTKLFIAFNICWLLLTVTATLMHTIHIKFNKDKKMDGFWGSKRWNLIRSWSLIKNVSDCFTLNRTPVNQPIKFGNVESNKSHLCKPIKNRANLEPLEGVKTISSLWIIWIHSYMLSLGKSWKHLHTDYITSKSLLTIGSPMAASAVDMFFVMTGVLTARSLFQLPPELLMSPSFWLKFIVYRYARIIPLYSLIHWFLKSSFRFLGSGPLWDYGTSHSSWSSICQNESYWTTLLPSANFKSPTRHCNPVGWYLANDIQLALLTPIFVLLYVKSPKLGHVITFITCVALTIIHVVYYYINIINAEGMFEWTIMWLTQLTEDVTAGYVQPQYRCVSYIMGLVAGYVLLRYECGHIKTWPRWFKFYGQLYCYFTLYLICSAVYLSSAMPFDNPDLTRLVAAISQGTVHVITGLACSIFILILCTDRNHLLSRMFKAPFLRPFGNASLSVVLVHMPLAYYMTQSMTSLIELSTYQIATMIFSWIIESMILALSIYVIYESPIRKFLVKSIIYTTQGSSNTGKRSNALKESVAKDKIKEQ